MKGPRSLCWFSCILSALSLLSNGSPPAQAATIAVTTTTDELADPGPGSGCSLREAIQSVNGAADVGGCVATGYGYGSSTIDIPAGTYRIAIPGPPDEVLNASGSFDILNSVTLVGAGAPSTFIDGALMDRVFFINDLLTVAFSGVTVTNGLSWAGSGILLFAGQLTVLDTTITNNTARQNPGSGCGGGIAVGEDDSSFGTVSVINSTISGNSADWCGGGIAVGPNSTISVVNSTISGNSAGFEGGGVSIAGGGTFNNSTISGNSAGSYGGGVSISGSGVAGANFSSSTISGNSGGAGSPNLVHGATGLVTLSNTIVENCLGSFASFGHNLEVGSSCGFTGTGDLQVADALLGTLDDYGGPTKTMALLEDSPAIDAGSCEQATDQRGVARPQGRGCDIGAYEAPGNPLWLGSEFQVNTYTPDQQIESAVAADGSGNFVVVWASGSQDSGSQDGSSLGVFGQRFNSAGNKVGSEFQVNTYTTDWQRRPEVAADGSGNFVVVWESLQEPHQGNGWNYGVFGQRFDSAGSPMGSEFHVNSYTTGRQTDPKVAVDGAGNFVVVWGSGEQDGSYDGVFGQRFNSAGSPVGSEFQVNSFTTGTQGYQAVAADDSGNFVVVWTSYDDREPAGGGVLSGSVFGQRFDSAGSRVGSEFQVNTYTTNRQSHPRVAGDGSGNFVVVWQSKSQDGSAFGVFGQRFDSAGSRMGSEFQVNSDWSGYQLWPDVAMAAPGNFVVAWTSGFDQDGSEWGVFGQRFDSAGSPVGSEFQVNSYATGGQELPALAADGLGNFVVVWNGDDDQDGSGWGVFGQRLAGPIPGCVADGDSLCLNDNRFRVEVDWRNYAGQTGVGKAVPFRADSGLFWFFGPSNLEILIKVIDGCGLNQRYWVYAAATTDVEYHLTVTDTTTDVSREYFNTLGNRAAAITDSDAFATCGSAVGKVSLREAVSEDLEVFGESGNEASAPGAPNVSALAPLSAEVLCSPADNDLCLGNNRFRVSITWRDYNNHTGSGWAVPYTNDSGMFWFFGADNIEFLVKVIDGCGFNSRYWVYAAATTDVEYTMTVTDTLMNVTKTYTNPLGTASPAITDSSAFATCP